jgi:heparin binding hemagglutinin HbhA
MPTVTKPTVTPLYAIAGAGDLAVEKIREYGDDLSTRVVGLKDQPKTVQTELSKQFEKRQAELTKQFEKGQAELKKGQAELTKQFEKLTADAKTVPAKLRELPSVVSERVNTVLGEAEATYDELAGRGKKLVTRIRKQAATEDLTAQVKTTASKAKATKTSATKNVKATATSARKSAASATTPASDAANKIGD